MIIVKRISDNIVLYLVEDNQSVELTNSHLTIGRVKVFGGVNSSTCVIESSIKRPPHFYGGAYAYAGGWTIGDQSVLDGILPDVAAVRVLELNSVAESVANHGVTVGAVSITSDDASVSNITNTLSLMGRSPVETVDFKSLGGWKVGTKASMEGLQNAIWALKKATNTNHKLHEEAINALLTVQEILDYDITTGWPIKS